jgi:ferrous iron transport protein A
MKLSKLNKSDKAKVTKIKCDNALKQRFYSFGLIEGVEVLINEVSIAKRTIEIIVENTSIAIRIDEAAKIEVEKL